MWQTIEYKAAAIEQFRKGDLLQRVIDDVQSEAANAAEMKAAASGKPAMGVRLSSASSRWRAGSSSSSPNMKKIIFWTGAENTPPPQVRWMRRWRLRRISRDTFCRIWRSLLPRTRQLLGFGYGRNMHFVA